MLIMNFYFIYNDHVRRGKYQKIKSGSSSGLLKDNGNFAESDV